MKILRYILGIVIFSSVSFLSQGQDITGITPDVFCNSSDTVKITIVGQRIAGSDSTTALKLDGSDISTNITYVNDLSGNGIDTIMAFLPLSTTAGTHNITVERDGSSSNNQDTDSIKILDPNVTISTDDNTICHNTAPVLKFNVSGTFGETSVISYTVNGVIDSVNSSADGEITVPVGAITVTTTYALSNIKATTLSCERPASGAETIVVSPANSGTLAVSDSTICQGESVFLFFNANNPNGDNLTFYYSDDSATLTTSTTNNFALVALNDLSATTTFRLDSVLNSTTGCLTTISNNNVKTITINNAMDVSIAVDPASICQGENYDIDFSVTGRSGSESVTIQYTKANSNNINTLFTTTVASDNISISGTESATTTYSLVSITNTTTGCVTTYTPNTSSSTQILITPSISYSINTSNAVICEGASTNLIFSVDNPNNQAITIFYSDGTNTDSVTTTTTSATATVSPTTNTTYTATRVKTTTCEYSLPGKFVDITVNQLPDVTISGNGRVCKGTSLPIQFNITNKIASSDSVTVQFLNGGNLQSVSTRASSIDVLVTPLVTTNYPLISVTNNTIGCTNSNVSGSIDIEVDSLPTATLALDTNFVCRGIPTNINFTVQNNGTSNVWVKYSRQDATMSVPIIDSVLTNSTLSVAVTPDITTSYKIVETRNDVTGCVNPASSTNVPQTLNVYQLPTVIPSVDPTTSTVCSGDNVPIEFDFPVGVAPFSVYFVDSFTNSTMRIDTGQVWTSLASGASVIQGQESNTTVQVDHIYLVTQVVDGFGCVNNYAPSQEPSVTVQISAEPLVTLTGVQPVNIPYASTDQTPYEIRGFPKGGPLLSSFSGPGFGLTQYPANQNYAYNNFIPANAGFAPTDTSIDVLLYYSYQDPTTGCAGDVFDTARIKKALTYDFYNEGSNVLKTTYCRNEDSTYIFAKITESDTINTIGNNTFILANNSGKVYSNVQAFGDSIRVTFTPLDSTGVFPLRFGSIEDGFDVITLTVIDTINTVFSPNIDSSYFCQDSTEVVKLTGIPLVSLPDTTTGSFSSPTSNLIYVSNGNANASDDGWFMRRSVPGWHSVKYTYEDPVTGCVTRAFQDVEISPAPVASFSTEDVCNDKSITFFDESGFTQSVVGIDSLVTWELLFGDGDSYNDTLPFSHSHIYGSSGVYNTELNVASARGCTSTFIDTFIIGTIPEAGFNWLFATLGDNTRFSDTTASITGLVPSDFIDSLTWVFGDGSTSISGAVLDVDTVAHTYQNIGLYQPVLYVSTNNGCVDSVTTNVYILPKIEDYPYYQRFDDGTGGWVPNPNIVDNYWEWKNPDGQVIQHSDPNNKAWVTELDSIYQNSKDAWVYSPTFDFTSLEKPFLAFRYWSNSRVSDGAVIQYSTSTIDSLPNWTVLGGVNTGLNWYDVDNLVSQPGKQSGFEGFGWTEVNVAGWKVARHKLDELIGEPKVRFRIAFALSPGSISNDGFAFDDFFIGERQKRVLVESFTHVNDILYDQVQGNVYNRIDSNNLDVILVEYHNEIPTTGLPSNDAFNLFNPADPSARTLYYQFSETGKMGVDGNIKETTTNGLDLTWTTNDFNLAMLEDPIFNVAIDEFTVTGNTVSVSATIKARKPMPAKLRKVYVAVVEDNLVTAGTSVNHKSVLRKLLPNASGTSLSNAWSIGTEETVDVSWTFQSGAGMPPITPANLRVVVWIQSDETRKVHQVASSDLPNIPYDSTVVNTEEPLDISTEEAFRLFPNPNNGNFTVQFEGPTSMESQWQLIDVNGRIVQEENVPKFTESILIDANNFVKGVYFFRLYNEHGISTVRKVIIDY